GRRQLVVVQARQRGERVVGDEVLTPPSPLDVHRGRETARQSALLDRRPGAFVGEVAGTEHLVDTTSVLAHGGNGTSAPLASLRKGRGGGGGWGGGGCAGWGGSRSGCAVRRRCRTCRARRPPRPTRPGGDRRRTRTGGSRCR